MLKIGVMGLGNIAQKAYLPVMATMQDQYEFHLTTRNPEKRQQLAAEYGFTHTHADLDELIAAKPAAVFVHTPTATHAAIIKQLLLADINVYVDKPVSNDLQAVQALYDLAASRHLLLTCGFNRRFAPFNQQLKALPDKRYINAEKIRETGGQDPETAVFDLMIHTVDTGLYLLDEPLEATDGRIVTMPDGALGQGYFMAKTAHTQLQVVTDMYGGVNLEQTTVQGLTKRATVTDLNTITTLNTAQTQTTSFPDWTPTLEKRGFAPLTRAFLTAVATHGPNPVDPTSAITSHAVCRHLLSD
ncbi:Gfo/Idh/MocA family protein [Lactiplantibacillus fabifermentans]|uniref:Oxidoreductase n=2 Tax=Lactiplantibacillus fabifermentans TaxID=483011 RepID=A0A0R2NTN6_9LACO|nr:Gfo/Idh/MocA family oxidoreductase [Lactiplantibacillus fabifermentans]ETY75096.1 oxidoreductase [Lactiplantibacillus fabifermentans T30PCM01]KRO27808.1 oxidoreductase [Lactiplantibacillus fabifermentans DSM 21115]